MIESRYNLIPCNNRECNLCYEDIELPQHSSRWAFLLPFLGLLFPFIAFAGVQPSVSPNPVGASCSNNVTVTMGSPGTQVAWFSKAGAWIGNSGSGFGPNTLTALGFPDCTNGTAHFIMADQTQSDWGAHAGADNYTQALTRNYYEPGSDYVLTIGTGNPVLAKFQLWAMSLF